MANIMSLPRELIYQILIRMNYTDIIHCSNVNREFKTYILDPIFWKNKLDYDYTVICNAKLIIPSSYMTPNNHSLHSYIRWTYKDTINIKDLQSNFDIIAYNIECNIYQHDTLCELQDLASKFGYLDILIQLDKLGFIWSKYHMIYALECGAIHVLNWLKTRGIILDHEIMEHAIYYYNANTLEWLESQGM